MNNQNEQGERPEDAIFRTVSDRVRQTHGSALSRSSDHDRIYAMLQAKNARREQLAESQHHTERHIAQRLQDVSRHVGYQVSRDDPRLNVQSPHHFEASLSAIANEEAARRSSAANNR